MTSFESDLTGRTVAVTGAASGIGAACAERFAAAGAEVICLDLNADAVNEFATRIGARPVAVDLSSLEQVEALDLHADVLVNNAGFQHVAPVEEFPVAVFTTMHALMVTTPFVLAQQVLPGMYEQGWGRIINISSIHGSRASAFKAAYVSAKHALEGLSKTIALEAGGRGVTSNCICPSYVRTPLVTNQIAAQARMRDIPEADVLNEVMLASTAVKRLVEPQEVAELAIYLCGPSSAMMNGASVTIDGGWTAQ